LSADDIVARECRRLGVKVSDIRGRSRCQVYVEPREEIAEILRRARFSFPEIAKALGRRNHTSAMHWVEQRLITSARRGAFIAGAGLGL
jgi:chromosomal replication initiation ATPase DnaA